MKIRMMGEVVREPLDGAHEDLRDVAIECANAQQELVAADGDIRVAVAYLERAFAALQRARNITDMVKDNAFGGEKIKTRAAEFRVRRKNYREGQQPHKPEV